MGNWQIHHNTIQSGSDGKVILMKIEIRDYTSNDALQIKTIFAEFVEYHSKLDNCFCKIDTHCEKFIEFIEMNISKNNDHVAVAEFNSKIVGYCISKIEHKPPIYPTPTYGYIDNLGVLNDCQRQGAGSLLLTDSIDWFKKNGIKRVECFAATSNIKSTNFWRKMGFNVYMEQMYLNL